MFQESLLSTSYTTLVTATEGEEDRRPSRLVFLTKDNQRWLKVPLSIVAGFGIGHLISKHSYCDDHYAYLHEAQDVKKLMAACIKGRCYPFVWSPELTLPWPESHYRLISRAWVHESA